MENINNDDKKRLIQFINENELDYDIYDSEIFKFKLQSYDDKTFNFYKYENKFVVTRYDIDKDKQGLVSTDYYQFDTLTQVLEQLKVYDESFQKTWWVPIADTIELGVRMNSYNEEWYSDFLKNDKYVTENYDSYSIITYNDESYKPELFSPFNTLHEVSLFNDQVGTKMEKLYFEIHPITCSSKNETYLFKLALNDEPILKEWINYKIIKKKGMRLFLETFFKEMEKYKI